MLNFFPTPYPDELWYSVLCRYHIRSGNPKNQTTRLELSNNGNYSAVCILFPNNSIKHIVDQLPNGLFDVNEIILNHTLFNYHMRMYPIKKKEELLKSLCYGTASIPTNFWKTSEIPIFRYCPVCVKEDREFFGEPYWHREHQVPLMMACRKHKCRLKEFTCSRRQEPVEKFIPVAHCDTGDTPCYEVTDVEIKLSELSYQYLTMPFETGPTSGHNNLTQELYNKGYGMPKSFFSLNFNKIYNDLISIFGDEMVQTFFGRKTAIAMIARIHKWSLISPERYIMLSVLADQKAETTFSPNKIQDVMEEELNKLRKKGIPYKKKYVAEQLGISSPQLDALVTRLKIPPFWLERNIYASDKKRSSVKAYFNEEDKAAVDQYAEKKNFANTSDFIKYCIEFVMKENLP